MVLYCAQDQEFAEDILRQFHDQSSLRVDAKFDTEANKSVPFYLELVAEKNRPRCDVFWNNEILSTIRLQRHGLLQPYNSLQASELLSRFPPSAVCDDGTWHAFATRARVLLVNTKLLPEKDWPKSLLDLTHERFKGKAAMAKPTGGTSATQVACLFEVLGRRRPGATTASCANQIQIASGNKQAAELVGQGKAVVSVTDTDDAMDQVRNKRDVKILYPDRDAPADSRMGTLFIPNTVAILKELPESGSAPASWSISCSARKSRRNWPNPGSHQIPFNPELRQILPPEILEATAVKVMQVDFVKAAELWEEAYKTATEFAR